MVSKFCFLALFLIVKIYQQVCAVDPPYGQLQIKGRFLTDSNGNVVQLRGMSLFTTEYNAHYNNEITVYQLKCNWNTNVIRVPIAPATSCCGGWTQTKDREYLRLTAVIDAAIKHGIYVIADWHAFEDPQIDGAIDFFTNISTTYGSYPNIIYEIWNEPDGDTADWPTIKSYAEQIIPIIRKNDPNNIIIVGTPNWSQRVDIASEDPLDPKTYPNVAYTLHYYAATHKQDVRDNVTVAINQNLPIFITEYGTVEATGGGAVDYNESALWWEFDDHYQLSYVNWAIYAHAYPGDAACCLDGTTPTQVGDPNVFTPSGKLVHKKLTSTDQGVYCSALIRIDCHPDLNATQETCNARGCVFDEYVDLFDPTLNTPQCYFPFKNTGYVSEVPANSSDTITLKKPSTTTKNPFGTDFDELTFQSTQIGNGLYVSISPKGVTRYRPPVPINPTANIASTDKLNIVKNNNVTFSFVVQRQSTGTKIWDTSIGGLMFADKYIQIAAYLPTDKIYGWGEQCHTSLKHNISAYQTYGMWSRDNEVYPNRNLYGVHPFYMGIEDDGKAHGVFIFNSNGQDITLGPGPHMVYRTIGGQLEIFFFPGPTPEQVIQQYQQIIGTPAIPAYWALGFHICRYNYQGTQDVKDVVNRLQANNIPLDTVWADINYMVGYKDFTIDPQNWGDFGNYTDYLHQQGMHVILITDPAIEVDYDPFQRGLEQNASFIEWPSQAMVPQEINNQYPLTNGTKIMLGVVWPDKHVAFPDFLDPNGQTNQWWSNEFAKFRQLVALDGIWIDMNEPSNFNTAFYNSTFFINKSPNQNLSCPESGANSEFDTPPYLTWSGYYNGPHLATGTLCMCGVTARRSQKFYDTKNLYGWSETVATNLAQKQAIGKRGAVISRSSFPSSGKYGGKWTGDNHATWDDLKYSIVAIQEFNIFGIPFVGADICGFIGSTTEELCLRWQQLGAFYPFMRNHHSFADPPQDPGVWPSVAEGTKKANLFRYRHLPYLYSLLFNAALNGGTVARSVFFEFPNDNATYDLSFQFMWGSALMIMPVTEEFVAEVNGYLPIDATWYSVYDYFYGSQVNNGSGAFPAPSTYLIPVFVRGGYIVPRQRPSVTTTLSRQNEFQLLVALDPNHGFSAKGELYWDDGETWIEDISTYNFYHFHLTCTAQKQTSTLTITATKQASGLTLPSLDNIEIFGYPYTPNLSTAKLNGNPIKINTAMSSYSPFTKVLNITTTNFINLNANGPTWTLTWDNQ